MRHNYTIRKSNLAEYYDVEYELIPDQPFTSKIINHPRKLITVNLCADPYRAAPQEVYHEPAFPFY